MALDAVQQLAGAGGVHCSDKILMTINRPDNFQQTIDLSFEHFSLGRHTDVSLVADGGEKVDVNMHLKFSRFSSLQLTYILPGEYPRFPVVSGQSVPV